ncbi:uncharacterized protein LOC133290087 [Gastrolobium bilobum]|uniref:uncharacterized protein LOC133290087 n=1 Tax=Gastrolobium bilobum TaxID=150636 RepID=UPI002AB0AB1A|nr:uncharacterized protein LOC133290087 [Gastrolobium bilobum]
MVSLAQTGEGIAEQMAYLWRNLKLLHTNRFSNCYTRGVQVPLPGHVTIFSKLTVLLLLAPRRLYLVQLPQSNHLSMLLIMLSWRNQMRRPVLKLRKLETPLQKLKKYLKQLKFSRVVSLEFCQSVSTKEPIF